MQKKVDAFLNISVAENEDIQDAPVAMESDGSEGKDERWTEMDGDAAFLIGDTALTPPSTGL